MKIIPAQKIAFTIILLTGFFSFYLLYPFQGSTIKPDIHGLILDTAKPIMPFSLPSTTTHPITEQSLKGKWSLIFFGYTYCPDICPTTLTILNQAYTLLEKNNLPEKPQTVFISVDPNRDSISRLAQYVGYFNPEFIAATGSKNQIDTLTKTLGIPYFIDDKTDNENYLVDHGSMIAVINPDGKYQAVLTAPHTAKNLAEDIPKIQHYFN